MITKKNINDRHSSLVDVWTLIRMDANKIEPSCSSSDKIIRCNRKHQDDEDAEESDLKQHEVPQSKLSTSIYEYLVVISVILIIFAAFRNSVTW